MSSAWRRSWVLVIPLIGSSCGYSVGSLVPREYRRVSVPVFENTTYWRDLELALTREVASELASRPGLFLVKEDEADVVLRGTIVDFQTRVLIEDNRDRVRESSARTTVRVDLLEARGGALLKSFRVTDRAEFFFDRGERLATATGESFIDLARKVVNVLEEEFPRTSERAVEPALN